MFLEPLKLISLSLKFKALEPLKLISLSLKLPDKHVNRLDFFYSQGHGQVELTIYVKDRIEVDTGKVKDVTLLTLK